MAEIFCRSEDRGRVITLKPFFSATLTNTTPVFLGGYDTQYARDGITEGLRTQSLKGLIRYWMRVYLASTGYTLENIVSKVNELLGGKTGNNIHASKIKINCNDNINTKFHTLEAEAKKDSNKKWKQKTEIVLKVDNKINDYYKKIPRISLISLAAKNNKRVKLTFADRNELKSTIVLSERITLEYNDKILVIGSLITGLLLSGLGNMSRRGFGCFDIMVEEDYSKESFKDIVNKIFDRIDVDERISLIKKVIKTTRDIIDNNYNLRDSRDMPRIHALHPDHCKILYVYYKNVYKENILERICTLQLFTVRSLRSKRLGEDCITNKKLAWFMGLPRSQSDTGYFPVDKNIKRRASAMFISVHKDFALVSFFKSKDWPNRIEWKGNSEPPFEPDIEDAFNTTIDSFKRYMNSNGYVVKDVDIQ